MKILVITIGSPKSRPIKELAADYSKRVAHHLSFEIKHCRDEKTALSILDSRDFFIVLDEKGTQKTSRELAELIATHKMRGTKRLVFFIGGPDGASAEIKKRAGLILGLSRMTLPHELAIIVIAEQLYRACSILKGEPYHRS